MPTLLEEMQKESWNKNLVLAIKAGRNIST